MADDTLGTMATTMATDLTAAIDRARAPMGVRRVPRVDLATRLRTSAALHRLLPPRLALARAGAKGRRHCQDPTALAWSRTVMTAILAGTAREGEIEELAKRRLVEEQMIEALFWQRPWRPCRVGEDSRAARDRAFASGRRVVVSACHLGPFFLQASVIAETGVSSIAVSAPFFFAEPTPDRWGRRLARWWMGLRDRGDRVVYSVGSFEVLRALIELDETVLIYFDLPGSMRTRFLGKPVMLASGTAQLAHQTDALVLPIRCRREGTRVWADVFEALDPRDYAGAEELQGAIAAVHERSILEFPECLEDPTRAGAWESAAGPEEWARPRAD